MAADVSEMLRDFALKKMQELEKEREHRSPKNNESVKTKENKAKSKDSALKDRKENNNTFGTENPHKKKSADKKQVKEVKIETKPEVESYSQSSLKNIEKVEHKQDETHNIGDGKKSGQAVASDGKIKINIATKELKLPSTTEDEGNSESESSGDGDDVEDSDNGSADNGKPWRNVPEEGEIVDSDGKDSSAAKEKAQENSTDKGKDGKSGKKKHKKHKKKSKKKKHKHDKDRDKKRAKKDKEIKEEHKDRSSKEKDRIDESRREKRKHSHRSRSRSRSRSRNKKYRRSRSRSRSPNRYRRAFNDLRYKLESREHYKDRQRPYDGPHSSRDVRSHRSRSPRKERTPVAEFDKAKLLEIAKANVYAQQKAGLIPLEYQLPPPTKEEILVQKSGGKTIDELTRVCQKIAEKQLEIDSSDEEPINKPINSDDEEQGPFVHHPFQVKSHPLPTIVMNIKNAIQKPVQDKDTLLKQFPVSSGTQHRKKEAEPNPYGDWVLVKKDFEHKPTTASSAKTFTETTPVNSTTIVPAAITATAITTAAAVVTTSTAADVAVALAAAPAVAATAAVTPAVVAPLAIAGASNDSVFPKQPSQLNVDITTMVTERLQAMRKLQENPHDVEAMGVMYKANQQIQSWAQASHKPGQYTGSTDAQILKPTELANSNPKGQAWAKKDMFHNTLPVKGGMGMYLLQKMGWKYGEGLGKHKEGSLLPLCLDVKTDRKGLVACGETQKKKAAISMPAPIMKDLSGKHPVSALMEICNKRKWPPPEFNLVHDSGPDHKKNFVFKVKVGADLYQPTVASPNKKHAKAQAATVALQKMGLIPADGP